MTVDRTQAVPVVRVPTSRAAHIPLAVLSLLACGALTGASYAGTISMLVAVGALQAVTVLSWVYGSAPPGRIGALIMGTLGAGAADAVVTRWHADGYAPLVGVLGVAVPVMFIHQLARGVVRTRVVESLADITILVVAVTAMSGFVLLRYQSNGDKTTLAVAGSIGVALAVSHFADALLPAPRFDPAVDRGLPGVLLGVLAGAAIGLLVLRQLIDFTGGRGAFVGAAVGAVACLVSVGASFAGSHSTLAGDDSPPSLAVRLRPVAAVLMTVALCAPAGYVLINALSSQLS